MAVPSLRRFASVDALRGLTVAAMLLVNDPGDWAHVYAPLLHSQWDGCTPTDLVFPFFLFIVGVSIALGIVPRVEAGADPAPLRRELWIRAGKIIGIGLAINLLGWWLLDKPHLRPWGVLQRIGLCFLVVGLLATRPRARVQGALIVALLLGYWALLALTGGFAPWTNLASRVDTALLGPLVYEFDSATGRGHDPEGLLSTLPAIATTLIGLHAGGWLRRGRAHRLLPGALGCLLVGWLWAAVVPWNKNLWTPSFVLWTAGWAMALLWLFHMLIDVRGWPALGRSLGRHALTVYVGAAVMAILLDATGAGSAIYRVGFAQWWSPGAEPELASLAFAMAFTGLWWGLAKTMERAGVVLIKA
ncbi:heparan-alpha-glucosaminide N-acetyltransferase domain-containing protein [Pseudoxanthomonas sp. JBR18]|uniref:acyltransferase family protein n=1 Tax=Pseudoxanthomonas sp. JBR18 TaxID=2969308 RepID=UPI00230613F6|nr:heparan-alpha-glucosaminide N-acetyltransferase domain-containing protein [Pseudoxanthomonas sp. JBR18]WCE05389.1 heparan-alpha-glucosaminide N-acetyltransferase domain-containing protein [Pseudoxanthomonas sp. JBR18]